MTDVPPMPDEWHPALTHWRGRLQGWLDEAPGQRSRVGDHMQVAVLDSVSWSRPWIAPWADPGGDPTLDSFRTILLHRRRCRGRAPYVGEPYVYEWWACVDEWGRGMAGRAWRVGVGPVNYGALIGDAQPST